MRLPSVVGSLLVVVLGTVAFNACKKGGSSATAPTSTTTPAPTPAPSAQFNFSYLGPTGVAGNNASAVELPDGRIRLYYIDGGMRSAVSSNGLSFTPEDGIRQPAPLGHIRVLRTPDGWRNYNAQINAGTITSAFSADGLTFTPDAGVRLTASSVGSDTMSTGTFVRLSGGRLRMYFSTFPPTAPKVIYSATSSDGLSWTLDSGPRTGPGTSISNSAFHPTALSNADGSVTLFFFVTETRAIHYATAADGLAFGADTRVALPGFEQNDPDVLVLSSGRILLFTARVDSPGGQTQYDVAEVTRLAGAAAGIRPVAPTLTPRRNDAAEPPLDFKSTTPGRPDRSWMRQ